MSDTTVGIGIEFESDLASVEKIAKKLEQNFSLAVSQALKSGAKSGLSYSNVKGATSGMESAFEESLTNAVRKSSQELERLNEEMQTRLQNKKDGETDESIKQEFKERSKKIIDEFSQRQKLNSDINKEQISQLKKGYDEIAKDLQEATAQAGKGFAENAKQGFKTLQSLGGNIKGLNFQGMGGDLSSLIKQGGKFGRGKMLNKAKALKASGDTAGAAKMANAAKMLGTASVAMAGVAVGLGAIVALLAKAFDHMQKMNKSILEQASVMEVASMASGNLKQGLKEIRSVATSSAMFMNGIKADDVIGIVGAFGSANLTMKELTATAKTSEERMSLLTDTMLQTTAVARMLGIKAQELGGNLATMMEEQGGGLQSMTGQFAALGKMAQNSGFQQKYFYQTVLESVSGMALYNARIAESGNLLIQLGKILGSKMASDTVKELAKGFKSEGIADSYKRVLKTGQATTQSIFKKEAQVASQQFLNTIGDDGSKALASALGIDLKGSAEEQATAISAKLGTLNAKQQEKLIGQMISEGKISRESVRQIGNLVDLSKAAKGDRVAMASAMDELGPGGVLQMQLKSVQGVLGSTKKFHEMTSFEELKVLEDVGGFSREQIERLQEISRQTHAQYGELKELQKIGYQNEQTAKDQINKFGAYINENGEIVSARLDKNGEMIDKSTERQVTSAEELVALQMAFQESEIAPAMQESEYWSREQAIATVSLNDLMEGAILAVLETIAGYLVPIVAWVTGDLSDEEKQAKQEALAEIQSDMANNRKEMQKTKDAIREQEKILATSKDKDDRDKAKKELQRLEKQEKNLKVQSESLKGEKSSIEGINYRETRLFGTLYDSGESAHARKRLGSAKDFRDVAKGGGVDTGLTTGEMALMGTGIGLFGLGVGVATGGTGLAAMGALGQTATVGTAALGGATALGGVNALEDSYNASAEKARYDKQKLEEEQKEESEKQTKELEKLNDTMQSQAGSTFAQSETAKRLGYGGGTSNEALVALGASAKAKGQGQELRDALKTSGFDEGQKATILSGLNDGFAFFRRGQATVVPIASQDDATVAVGREGGALSQVGGTRGGGNVFNFHGGSTAEIIAHFENLQSLGLV